MKFRPLEGMPVEEEAFGSIGRLTYYDNVSAELRLPEVMSGHHWHGHIEINVPFDGDLDYLIDETPLTIKKGHIGLFWATVPHKLTNFNQCRKVGILNIPLHIFSFWPIGDEILDYLMSGRVLQSKTAGLVTSGEFDRWCQNIKLNDSPFYPLALEEICLMIKRACIDDWSVTVTDKDKKVNKTTKASKKAQRNIQVMLKFIARNFSEDIKTQDIAQAADLHPNYAMNIFKQVMKMTIKEYVLALRLTYAKSMLADTDIPVSEVAEAVGFHSRSRFFDSFQKETGVTPRKFRTVARGESQEV